MEVSPCILPSQTLGLARVFGFKVITIVEYYSIVFLGSAIHILFESVFLNFVFVSVKLTVSDFRSISVILIDKNWEKKIFIGIGVFE